MDLSNRKFRILVKIVEKYILTGDPVGSKTLCESLDLPFSPATIRNEMASLANFGYLIQPHISSGRIPSCRGYRLYVNKLMTEKLLLNDEKNLINGAISSASMDPESLLKAAVDVLAEITGFTAIITTPINQTSKIREIEFVQISKRGAMIVLITSNGMIKNKLFRCEYDLNKEMLKMFKKILQEQFKGKFLSDINSKSVDILVSSDKETSLILLPIIKVFLESVEEINETKIKISGQKNLLLIPNISKDVIVDIFEFLEHKDKVFSLFNPDKFSVKFTIGEENNNLTLKNSSICSCQYNIADNFGFMGILGPTRMDYGSVSAYLEYVSSLIEIFLERIIKEN